MKLRYRSYGYVSHIVPLVRGGGGTNSTMFTDCCEVAICDDQKNCPKCGNPVIGDRETTTAARSRVRWADATRFWNKETTNDKK